MNLEDVTFAHFEGHVGEEFRLAAEGLHEPLATELIEAEQAEQIATPGGRVPFSLVFRGPWEPVLPQGIYGIEHDELGSLPIFIVPIGREDDGVRYQAAFS